MVLQITKHRFSLDDYHCIIEAGILGKDDKVELIDGEIIEVAPIGSRHAAGVDRLNFVFSQRVLEWAMVRVQNPISLWDQRSEPEPDVVLVRHKDDFYAEAHPTAEDVLLVVEVADTSLAYDIEVKLPIYAQAGIPEVWVMDLHGEALRTFSEPAGGEYSMAKTLLREESVSPVLLPEVRFDVSSILG